MSSTKAWLIVGGIAVIGAFGWYSVGVHHNQVTEQLQHVAERTNEQLPKRINQHVVFEQTTVDEDDLELQFHGSVSSVAADQFRNSNSDTVERMNSLGRTNFCQSGGPAVEQMLDDGVTVVFTFVDNQSENVVHQFSFDSC